MYREIEFRGKRIDGGGTVYGSLYQKNDGKCFIRVETESVSDMFEVDPNTIGQYTGLKDKNGHKIFENDLVILITKDFYRIFKVVYGETERAVDVLDGFDDSEINIVQFNGWLFELIYASDFDCSNENIVLLPKIDEHGLTDTCKMKVIDTDYYG